MHIDLPPVGHLSFRAKPRLCFEDGLSSCNRRNVACYRIPNELERRERRPADPRLSIWCDKTRRPYDREETRSSLGCDTRFQYRQGRDSCTTCGQCPSRICNASLFDAVDYLDALERTRRKSRSVGCANIKRPR